MIFLSSGQQRIFKKHHQRDVFEYFINPKSQKNIMATEDEHLMSKIVNSNNKIRFASVCDKEGNIISSQHRHSEENLLTLEETHESLQHSLERWNERDRLEEKIGHGRYAVVSYEKIKRVTIPLKSGNLMFFSIEGNSDNFIDDIMKLVEE